MDYSIPFWGMMTRKKTNRTKIRAAAVDESATKKTTNP
jgi:hypothetical protein